MPERDYNQCSNHLERIAKLEAETRLMFREHEKAIGLARIAEDRISSETKRVVDERLDALNQHKERLIRMESTFATKAEIAVVQKYIYVAMGAVSILVLILKFFVKF